MIVTQGSITRKIYMRKMVSCKCVLPVTLQIICFGLLLTILLRFTSDTSVQQNVIIFPPSNGSDIINLPLHHLMPDELHFVESRMKEMLHRLNLVKKVCTSRSELMTNGGIRNSAIWFRENNKKLFWCSMVKAATGTWTTNLLRVAHYNENDTRILALPEDMRDAARFSVPYGATWPTLKKLFPVPPTFSERKTFLETAIRFIVVRHPFLRILSAFRNKIEIDLPLAPDNDFFKELRFSIIDKYRRPPASGKNSKSLPKFREFVDYVIDSSAVIDNIKDWTLKVNKYWRPYWVYCNVCSSGYSVVIKLETMDDDERFLALVANLTEIKESKRGQWKSKWKHKNSKNASTDVSEKYFSSLSTNQMVTLYERYKLDFELFDYSIDEFLPMAFDAKPSSDVELQNHNLVNT